MLSIAANGDVQAGTLEPATSAALVPKSAGLSRVPTFHLGALVLVLPKNDFGRHENLWSVILQDKVL